MTQTLSCDVVVVGGGPAGIAAAATTAEAGADALLVDEGCRLGGQIWRPAMGKGHVPHDARRWLDRLALSKARIETGIAVVLLRPDGTFLAERDGASIVIEARKVILATGARERFVPFPGWTLPGVLGVGGAQALLKAGASFRGKRTVIAGSGPLLLPVAASLTGGGARIDAVAEQASGTNVVGFGLGLCRRPAKAIQAIRYRASFLGARYRTGVWVAAAHGSTGIESVSLTDGTRTWNAPCDVLACAYGLVPNLELPRALGCAIENGFVRVDAEQRTGLPAVWAAGEPTGIGGASKSLLEGEIAGLSATNRGIPGVLHARRLVEKEFAKRMATAFTLRPELRSAAGPQTIVCRCEDVALGRIEARWTRRQAKLYTRAGMGACQGRICGPALEFLFGGDPDNERPPVRPVLLSTLENS